MQLTKHFKLSELIVSKSHPELLVNVHIGDAHKWNLFKMCAMQLQPLRDYIKKPVTVTSGYRTKALNEAVGGRPLSQHLYGEAADLVILNDQGEVDQTAMADALAFIKSHLWPTVGECIDYRDAASKMKWIHLSLPDPRFIGRFYTILK